MHVSIAAILAAGIALVQAAPVGHTLTDRSPNPIVVLSERGASSVNDCGDSTFINQSSGGSPKISDCQQIATNIANGGTWSVESNGAQNQLVQYGTCALGVTGDFTIGIFYVGNQDIIDVINESISRFSWNGLVGAEGKMYCEGGSDVTWAIYHT
ncbi:necrosis-inducing factor-domain-containing protein [Penicillium angulare]|uniref:necrosis-inducing factor-domain-containing protein n=1 Tax=Penicillium angulare TaxID=116970 RepID=UPI0025422836|nr:necrosis-inducing factor-domain-containing protein [Penicillium angulare]KAJ5288624.1 necrosis-inducing factor-domain-containing protein [Penicillium angulare]